MKRRRILQTDRTSFMKQTYFMVVENTCEVIDIGEFESLSEAENAIKDYVDSLDHGHGHILIGNSSVSLLIANLEKKGI